MSRLTRSSQHLEILISLLALVVSIATATGVWNAIWPGTVKPYKPAGYALVRQIHVTPSDHIVVPLEWQNTSARSTLIRTPFLRLRKHDDGAEYVFPLAGEYANLSTETLHERYTIKNSLILEAQSITYKLLVFHIDEWWNGASPGYRFRFKSGDRFTVSISYQRDTWPRSEEKLFEMEVYPRADKLDVSTGDNWEYWSIAE